MRIMTYEKIKNHPIIPFVGKKTTENFENKNSIKTKSKGNLDTSQIERKKYSDA